MPRRFENGEGKRSPLNMRTTLRLREQIEAAAAVSGRSLAQEVEYRLEQSFGFGSDISTLIQQAVRTALAEDRAQREAEHEERCFAPRLEAIGRLYRY